MLAKIFPQVKLFFQIKTVYDMDKKISDIFQTTAIEHLLKNTNTVTDKMDIADVQAETFSKSSSSKNGLRKVLFLLQNAK